MSFFKTIKKAMIRRLADAIAEEQASRNSTLLANLHPTAAIMPEGVIDNTSGKKEAVTIGERSYLRGRLFVFANAGSITIGSWCYVGTRSEIWAMSDLKIGDRVQIAHNVTILDSSCHSRNAAERHAHFRAIVTKGHPHDWAELPGITAAPVTIEDDVWIGAGAIVMPGVRIGARSIVAAGAMVTADIPPDTIYWNDVKAESIPNYA